jgi:tRNA A-37 threonylcarbamoyl transferase component Bud32
MHLPADQPTPGASAIHPTLRAALRSPRQRRPTGAAPPLPYRLQTSGIGWLVAAVVLVGLTLAVFAHGLRGPAVPVTVLDDAGVRWLAGLQVPGLHALLRGLVRGSSWWVLFMLSLGLPLALLVLRRWRHLIVWLVAWNLGSFVIGLVAMTARRPRPFAVELQSSWGGWAMPSLPVAILTGTLIGVLYGLVPQGRWRNTGKGVAATLVAMVAVARIALGTDAPTDVLVAVGIGVTIPLLAFRRFAPNEVYPVTYHRGRSAHLDIGGARGQAIRRALLDQLGLTVKDIQPFGLSGSAGSTPLRITMAGDPPTILFGKLYARSHLRADRWYKLGRELLYGRLEDEKPFNTVRRLVEQEDYALRLCRDAGLPSPTPHGFVELTPDREYLVVSEFLDGAVELGEAEVTDRIIDDGLGIVRMLWHAGLAHRDIKPANLLVHNGRLLLIDVAFIEARPTPWRQAVDLANMMLCLALRSSPERVYQRARRQFSVEEITEGFAAARGLALPSQLRHLLRSQGRDLHAEFIRLLPSPPRPIRIQRWSARRVGLWAAILALLVLAALNPTYIFDNQAAVRTSLEIHNLDCAHLEPLWLQAQSVPSASMVPCLRPLPTGWSVANVAVNNGRSVITLNHDRAGKGALVLRLTPACDPAGAVQEPSPIPGVRHHQRTQAHAGQLSATWYDQFPGGCVTARLHPTNDPNGEIAAQAPQVLGFITRATLREALNQRSHGRLQLDPGEPR